MIEFNAKRFPGRLAFALLAPVMLLAAQSDQRQLVKLPEPMQVHMLANMRDHLATLNGILNALAQDDFDHAASLAERRLGMSSLELHGASHMAPFMPAPMRAIGTRMHRAASRFARKAREDDALAAYHMLKDVTAACVACHSAYRIR